MQIQDATRHTDHTHLVQSLSAMMVQISALQSLLRINAQSTGGIEESHFPAMDSIRDGLEVLEQMAREMLYELRSDSDDEPLAELAGLTLVEALSRAVEETAETIGLSSRIVFSGEERSLSSSIEGLLYRIAREALYQVQHHTGVHKLRFMFNYGRDEAQMSIEDDGTLVPSEEEIPAPPFTSTSPAPTTGDQILNPGGVAPIFSMLRHRLEHLGGSLESSSSIEQGTRVQARVPYVLEPISQPITATNGGYPRETGDTRPLSPPNSTLALTTLVRILVVDSQAVTRAGLRSLLATYADIDVIGEAADGVQAVSETLELGPQVVLLDAQLPNGQSMEALRQIKQLNPETKILLISALDREEYLYEILRAGADGLVLKDIAPAELAQAVRAVARGEVLVQPQIASRLLSRIGKQGQGNYPNEPLTAREREVLGLLARGLRNKEIASRLFVSERTVNFHLANIYQKLNVSGRTEALSKALEQGLIRA